MNKHLALALTIIGALIFFLYTAHAHDHNRPELDSWFNGLTSGKGPCCSNNDGQVVDDPDWEAKDGHYRVRLDGVWVEVEDSAVITEPNRAGRTMVWPFRSVYGEVMIRCFLPGSMT
jgi:hypothetical protein